MAKVATAKRIERVAPQLVENGKKEPEHFAICRGAHGKLNIYSILMGAVQGSALSAQLRDGGEDIGAVCATRYFDGIRRPPPLLPAQMSAYMVQIASLARRILPTHNACNGRP
ncbi:hypothetical protein GN244_ATG02947 [Phytophthora infestans]|uniref:Uncharacterized protein n=1 Tax=Phytophthora infestans TaxID=4787 RepID=A0A833WP15_PHYIN|nr:hypothetical protein GN244_ATG02947 [Phytophthora infestans]